MGLAIHWQKAETTSVSRLYVPLDFTALCLHVSGNVVQKSEWLLTPKPLNPSPSSFLQQTMQQFLENPQILLNITLEPVGTAFTHRVWEELMQIPYAETITYAQLADRVDSGARAVANACRSNPFAGIIPCHRVVAANGAGGFMGQSRGRCVELKQKLLSFEAAVKRRHAS